MKYTQSEKMEIIRMVEESSLSVKQTLREMDVPRSSFYEWYRRYRDDGYDGLASEHKDLRQVWNKIPEWEKERVVEVAREYPEKSCREIAWQLCRTMKAEDVKNTLNMAIAKTGVEHVQVVQRPRLLSDNGACFISHELKKYLETHEDEEGVEPYGHA
jgi:transposase-like protein